MELTVTKTLSDQIYDIIMERVFSGEYKQGDKLSVNKLALEFNVSRSPVNDAINKLSGASIVEMNKNSSCTIRSLSDKQIQDLFEYRKAIELYVAKNAFSTLTGTICKELKKIAFEGEKLSAAGTYHEHLSFFNCDEEFHQKFVGALGNNYIYEDYLKANRLLRLASIQTLDARYAGTFVVSEHLKIVSALEEKDYTKLCDSLCEHLDSVCKRMIKSKNN